MAEQTNLTEALRKLEEIADWFGAQQYVDVEEGLTKVKEAATLIKSSKARLARIENEFQEIEREISGDDDVDDEQGQAQPPVPVTNHSNPDEPMNLDDIPF